MKYLIFILALLFFFSCSKKLEDKEQTLDLEYISWACACANWATFEDIRKFQDSTNFSDYCIFVEPANKALELADTIGYSGDIVQFTGRFYIDKGYPKDYVKNEEPVDKARVFKYTSFKIIKSKHSESQSLLKNNIDTPNFNIAKGKLIRSKITFNVTYAAIECTCPQWFESKNMNDSMAEREYFYLEQGNENIINADTLYNGINVPLQLSITGQFYTKEGYPQNYHPAKGAPQPARVFKYDAISIISRY